MRKTLIPVLVALALAVSCSTHTAPGRTVTQPAPTTAIAPVTSTFPDKATLPVMETLQTIVPPEAGTVTPAPPARQTVYVAPSTASRSTTVPTAASVTATPVVVYVSVDGRANVRKAPSTAAEIVDRLARGTAVNATPVAGGAWYRIEAGRYIAAPVVSRTKPAPAPPTTHPSVPKSVTPKQRLDACIDQVDPNRTAKWFLQSKGPWGQTWIPVEEVYISPAVPPTKVCDVVRHEWMHVLQSRAWGLGLFDETNRILGTSGRAAVDQVADCGAELLGAKWVNYGCRSAAERKLAADLLAGKF